MSELRFAQVVTLLTAVGLACIFLVELSLTVNWESDSLLGLLASIMVSAWWLLSALAFLALWGILHGIEAVYMKLESLVRRNDAAGR